MKIPGYGDPELGNEDDPEYKEELFETYRDMGWKPEELTDAKYREEYAEWLKLPRVEDE
jgi:hypothetical protein